MRRFLTKSIPLFSIGLVLAGCLAKSSADEDYHPGIGVPRLTVSTSQSSLFSSTYVGGSADVTMTLTNRGAGQVTRLAAPALDAPLAYAGGTFPGTGGDCGTTLDAGASCTFVITYTPTTAAGVDITLRLTYYNGSGTSQKTMTDTISLEPASGTSGTLDTQTTANGLGYLVQTIGSGHDQARAAAIDCDGKLLVGGEYHNGTDFDMVIARFNSDGTLDTTWGTSGTVTAHIASSDYIDSLAVGADCLIYAAGARNTSALDMISLNQDGSFNTAFSSDGKVTVDFSLYAHSSYTVNHMLVQPDGKIILAGWGILAGDFVHFLTRITAAGVRDTSFADGGVYEELQIYAVGLGYTNNFITGIALAEDGDIVFTGESLWTGMTPTTYAVLGRLSSDGTTQFKYHGDVDAEIAGVNGLYGLVIDDDGKYVTGTATGLARFEADGTVDSSFVDPGTGGVSGATRFLRSSTGKYYKITTSAWKFAVVSYNSDLTLNSDFGTSGLALEDLGSANNTAYGGTIQNDGKLVVVGIRSNGSNWDFGIARFWP